MTKFRQRVFGFFAAPIPATILAIAHGVRIYWGTKLIILPILSWSIMLILGIPAVWLLRKWNFNSVLAYAILGGILPALAYTLAVISFWPASENEAEKMLSSLAIFVMFGIITAVSYWYIAKPNRA